MPIRGQLMTIVGTESVPPTHKIEYKTSRCLYSTCPIQCGTKLWDIKYKWLHDTWFNISNTQRSIRTLL